MNHLIRMRFKNLYHFLLYGFLLCIISCSEDKDIPPAIKPPVVPPVDDVYNDLGFTPHKEGDPFDTYRGLVMAGYQGWFCAPGSACTHGTPAGVCSHSKRENTKWYHYRESEQFAPGVRRNSIDMWPDTREYEVRYTPGERLTNINSGDRVPVDFILPNGLKAEVYSNYDKSTVMLHFKWMKDYGIDGVFIQRFVGEVIDNPDGKDHFDTVLESAMEASNTHQRAICVMYDLGGFQPDRLNKTLDDAQAIMDKYQLKDRAKQKFYLYHNGKPLIVMWGVGFNDGRPFSLTDVENLINGLKAKGFSIMLGVPTYWRERRNDAVGDLKLHNLIKSADVIMPWFVGRYGMNNYPDFHELIVRDMEWCKNNNVDYAPLCFPGSADRNMHPNNSINPRHGGQFLWNQMHHTIKSGAKMLYIAMFDEIDEGTAIYKCLNVKDVPSNEAEVDYYVTYRNGSYSISRSQATNLTGPNDWSKLARDLNVIFQGVEDNLPTDQYLWLTGQGRKMLRGEIPLKSTLPVRNQ